MKICYNVYGGRWAGIGREQTQKPGPGWVFQIFVSFSQSFIPFPLPPARLWSYSAPGRGLRKVVKLQLRHFWLLRPHKSKQKCRLAIESEKREFKGTERGEGRERGWATACSWPWGQSQSNRRAAADGIASVRISDSGFRISGSKLTIITLKEAVAEKNALGHYNFRLEAGPERGLCLQSQWVSSPLDFRLPVHNSQRGWTIVA